MGSLLVCLIVRNFLGFSLWCLVWHLHSQSMQQRVQIVLHGSTSTFADDALKHDVVS